SSNTSVCVALTVGRAFWKITATLARKRRRSLIRFANSKRRTTTSLPLRCRLSLGTTFHGCTPTTSGILSGRTAPSPTSSRRSTVRARSIRAISSLMSRWPWGTYTTRRFSTSGLVNVSRPFDICWPAREGSCPSVTAAASSPRRERGSRSFYLDVSGNFAYQLIEIRQRYEGALSQEAGYGYGNLGRADGHGHGHDVEL